MDKDGEPTPEKEDKMDINGDSTPEKETKTDKDAELTTEKVTKMDKNGESTPEKETKMDKDGEPTPEKETKIDKDEPTPEKETKIDKDEPTPEKETKMDKDGEPTPEKKTKIAKDAKSTPVKDCDSDLSSPPRRSKRKLTNMDYNEKSKPKNKSNSDVSSPPHKNKKTAKKNQGGASSPKKKTKRKDKDEYSSPEQVSDSDAVSVSSDDEKDGNDVILVENDKKNNGSDEIHEIKSDSDDDDVEAVIEKCDNEENVVKNQNCNANNTKLQSTVTKVTAINNILPTLTDDMHVVEVPSFIIPYLYEKPPKESFKAALAQLSEIIEEEEKLEKEKREKEKQDRKERREKGEDVEDSEVEEDEEKKRKAEKKERRRRKKEDDDVSWDGESSSESDDDLSGDEAADKDKDTVEEISEVTDLTSTQQSFFSTMLGKYFISIGSNLVQQYVQSDLLAHQKMKLKYEKKRGKDTVVTESSVMLLSSNLHASQIINRDYQFKMICCKHCGFKTESKLVLANHLEKPHYKNNLHHCNNCDYKAKSANDVIIHMGLAHQIKGKIERPPALHQCANCPFEDSGKAKLARHLIPCAKKFKPQINLAPPIDWEPPAKIPKITKRNVSLAASSYQNVYQRHLASSTASNGPRFNIPSPVVTSPRPLRPQGLQILRPGTINRALPPVQQLNKPTASVTPTPVNRPQAARPVKPAVNNTQQNKGTFVICEICDGYIKDLEQLRNHMQWIHKVKINSKMIYNRPPLNCQKCMFRFFTDQGLERHLLGSHGLVTNSMQEAANRGKDGGRCPVCGRVYQWKLLSHVGKDHNMTLKPAHLSYKCTVCTATFGMYKLFENHVYSAHSGAAKKAAVNKTASAVNSNNTTITAAKRIGDDVTITPQPAKKANKK